jgi:hypothetical protein
VGQIKLKKPGNKVWKRINKSLCLKKKKEKVKEEEEGAKEEEE